MGTGCSSSSHRRRTSKLLKKHIMAGSPGLDFVYELLAMTARGEEEDEAMWGHITPPKLLKEARPHHHANILVVAAPAMPFYY